MNRKSALIKDCHLYSVTYVCDLKSSNEQNASLPWQAQYTTERKCLII